MISVQTLFLRTNRDLVKKGKGEYENNETFNRDLEAAQEIFMNYCVDILERTGRVTDSLSPFLKEVTLDITSELVTKPSDYKYWIDLRFIQVINDPECDEPIVNKLPMSYVSVNEEYSTVTSYIRKPNVDKKQIIYSMVNDKIRVPKMDGRVNLKYIRNPSVALRAVTLNGTTDEEDYVSGSTDDLEWNAQDINNFVNILLNFKGIEIKDNDIIQFANK